MLRALGGQQTMHAEELRHGGEQQTIHVYMHFGETTKLEENPTENRVETANEVLKNVSDCRKQQSISV